MTFSDGKVKQVIVASWVKRESPSDEQGSKSMVGPDNVRLFGARPKEDMAH